MSILFENITILDKYGTVQSNYNVYVKDGKIAYIGKNEPLPYANHTIRGEGKLLMPGFYNAHSHSPMTLMRGYGENMKLDDWLHKRIFPFEAQLDREAVYWAALLHMAESFRSGIVSSTDMYFFCEAIIEAAVESGAKMNVGRALTSFDETIPLIEMEAFKEVNALVKLSNGAYGGRIRVEAALHAEYTSTPRLVREIAEYAASEGLQMQVHLSETKAEHEACKQRHEGKTPARYFYEAGLFDVKTTAAHGVWLEKEDLSLLAEKKVTIASCPVSNLKLASGVCPVPELIKAGVDVAIGTDSVASNNSLDFFEEMKFFSLLQKGWRADPTLLTPREAMNAAMFIGAKSQGRTDCGRIAEGYRADLIVIDLQKPWLMPMHDLYNNLVYSASGADVWLTMIDGKVVYHNGEYLTLDIDRVLFEVNASVERILGKVE